MKRIKIKVASLMLLFGMLLFGDVALAHVEAKGKSPSRAVVVKHPSVKSVRRMSSKHTTIRYNDIVFHLSKGKYYRKVDSRYVLIMPPVGLRVQFLPDGSSSFRFKSRYYHCAGGVIYVKVREDEYKVVAPEVGMIVPELPEVGVRELSIDNDIYYEYDDVLYKAIVTRQGVEYKVVGSIE
ncbi:MAG: DUF6515 family protein [Rikenellaceae bacterium]